MNKYLDENIRKGQPKPEIVALVNKIRPDAFTKTHELATEYDVSNGECFYMRFDITLDGDRYLNRYICFDGDGVLFYVVQELAL